MVQWTNCTGISGSIFHEQLMVGLGCASRYMYVSCILPRVPGTPMATTYHIQWNLEIRDTRRTVKNSPEFWGGLISQVHFYVMNRPRDWSSCHWSSCPYFSGGLKIGFTVHDIAIVHLGGWKSTENLCNFSAINIWLLVDSSFCMKYGYVLHVN